MVKSMDLPVDNDTFSLTPSPEGVKKFLSSPYVSGIGPVLADRIVNRGGSEILGPEFNFSEELNGITGLPASKIETLQQSFKDLKYPPSLIAFLYSCGLSTPDIEKILSHYKKHTLEVVEEDPYQMVEEVFKLSFFTADKIGRYLGIAPADDRRLRGALLTAVKIYAENGNMYATEEEAVATAAGITSAGKELFAPQIDRLVEEERLIRSKGGLYLPVYYKAEKEGAEKLASLIRQAERNITPMPLPTHDREGHPLSEGQLKAIETVMRNPVTIITGGPGTGKTTTVRGIIKLLEDMDKNVILAAPTGRAAKRLSDLSGREAKTIHRLLGYSMGKGYRNKHFDADILIIDEASMLEQVLFNHLLQAMKPHTKIVLVGDPGQLPAIGAGDVLKDMIASSTIPVVTLNENFRQAEGSMIASNAASIKEGVTPEGRGSDEFIIITEETSGRIHKRLLQLVAEELPEKYGIEAKDIQVVTPQQEGPLGAKQLNLDLQARLNPDAPGIRHGLKFFRLGDRVMQKSNSSERHTYNGETGWISNLNEEEGWLEVTFYDGKKSIYGKKDLKELNLAYATTVHKLQGSETDYMVMPMTITHKPMLYRNLLYTGVSRAKKLCVLVGEEKAIRTAVETEAHNHRNSNFKTRLRNSLPSLPEFPCKSDV